MILLPTIRRPLLPLSNPKSNTAPDSTAHLAVDSHSLCILLQQRFRIQRQRCLTVSLFCCDHKFPTNANVVKTRFHEERSRNKPYQKRTYNNYRHSPKLSSLLYNNPVVIVIFTHAFFAYTSMRSSDATSMRPSVTIPKRPGDSLSASHTRTTQRSINANSQRPNDSFIASHTHITQCSINATSQRPSDSLLKLWSTIYKSTVTWLMAAFIIAVLTIHDTVCVPPPPYIPKGQRNRIRAMDAGNKSWIKPIEAHFLYTMPGECVSVDQLSSPTPGLIAQMTGYRTKQRYTTATVYVDQATGRGYVHPQKSTSIEETVESKKAFEAFARSHGVPILQYHADNGIFKANLWLDTCKASHQTITFAGVGAHHQNGVVERRIRELQDMARTMLIHAQRRWPKAINANLWPYAIRMENDSINMTPNLKFEDHRTPLEPLSLTEVTTNPNHWHHFGCPVCVLSSNLQQAGGIHHKRKEKARLGVYLALVMDVQTGFVSPQFHNKLYPTFQTIREGSIEPTISWQEKCSFITQDKLKRDAPHPPRDITPRQATPENQGFHSEGVQGKNLPIEASLQREQQDASPIQGKALPIEASLQRQQQDAPPVQDNTLPTEASLQREKQDTPPAAPSPRIDETTKNEKHDLRRSTE
jgi:hypothetical protein